MDSRIRGVGVSLFGALASPSGSQQVVPESSNGRATKFNDGPSGKLVLADGMLRLEEGDSAMVFAKDEG